MASTKRLNESEIEARLHGRHLAIVKGTFKNIREPAQWVCLADSSHGIFLAPPKQIIHANGSCPRCGKVSKLTEDLVRERLGARPLKLITGTLKGSDVKATWECLSDQSHGTWQATPSAVLNSNSGCPVCSGKLPLNEVEIKSRLAGRNLDLVDGTYDHKSRNAKWRCLVDERHTDWTTSVKSILYQKTGCPVCAGNIPLTEEVVIERLFNRPIELVQGTLNGARANAYWRCLKIAEHPMWQASPGSVLGGSNCPACTGHERITASVIQRKIQNRNVTLLSEEVASSIEFATWGCKTDTSHKSWSATVSSVLGGSGCPECAGNAKLTGEIINERLAGRAIRIDESSFKSSGQHARWLCLAGRSHPVWSANVSSVLQGVGCPSCAEYGFKENKPAYIYLLQVVTDGRSIGIKCGITNNDPKKRLGQIRRKSTATIDLIRYWHHQSGAIIRSIEGVLLKSFRHNDLGDVVMDGRTETFHTNDIDAIIDVIEKSIPSPP